jgi:hypothetical protein
MKFNKHGIAKVFKPRHGEYDGGDPFLIALSVREAQELQEMINNIPTRCHQVVNQEIHVRG